MKIAFITLILVCLYGCSSDNKKPHLEHWLKLDSIINPQACDTLLKAKWDTSVYHKKNNLKPGQYFRILEDLDFDNGNWAAIIVVEHAFRWTWTDSNYFPQSGYYILTDTSKLKSMQRDWVVKYLGADCCTDDFRMYFLRNNKLVFGTGIISDGGEGFQNSIYGYTPLKEERILRKYYGYFSLCKKDFKGVGGFRYNQTSP